MITWRAPVARGLTALGDWLDRSAKDRGEVSAGVGNGLAEVSLRIPHDGVAIADERGDILEWSTSAEALFERSASDVQGRSLTQLFREEERASLRDEITRALEDGGVHGLQLSALRPSGRRLDLEVSLVVLHNQGVARLGVVVHDITKQVLTQLRLREAERSWRDLASNFSDTLLLLDRSGMIVYANRELAELPVEEVIGCHAQELVFPAQSELICRGLQAVFERGVPFSCEGRRDSADGSPRWLWCRMAPRKEDDQVAQAVLAITDLTERRQRDLAHQRLAAIVRSTSEAVISVGPDRRLSTWNHGAEMLFGWSEREAVGQPAAMLSPPEEMAQQQQYFERLQRGEALASYECVRLTKDGRRIPVAVTTTPLRSDAGEFEGSSAVIRDLSAQREFQAALEHAKEAAETMARLKGEFLANMSHEIRTPLNGVVGMTELLAVTLLDEQQRGYLSTLLQACQTLRVVVDDILDFSKIEAGKMSVESLEYDLPSLVQGVVSMSRAAAAAEGTVLSLSLPRALPQRVLGDPNRVRQVLMNLVSNAVKFTRGGTVDVRLEVQKAEPPYLRVEVQDTGIGMSPETCARIFQPFSQADGSTTRRFGGTGLGLAISGHLLELMGGSVQVQSELGKGSTFVVTLPMVLAKGSGPRQVRKPSSGLAVQKTGWRILVAEDNAINRQVVSALLRNLGCEVDVAHNGREAIEQARAVSYDAILMDCQMPELSGFEAAAAIRREERPEHHVPIIAITAQAYAEDRERCASAGMDDHLAKPITRSDLKHLLGKWLQLDTRPPTAVLPLQAVSDPVDRAVLERLRESLGEGGEQVLREIILGFLEEGPDSASRLRRALNDNASERVAYEAHRLRSSTGNLAATGLCAICQRLETSARVGDLSAGASLLDELQYEYGRVALALRAYVEQCLPAAG